MSPLRKNVVGRLPCSADARISMPVLKVSVCGPSEIVYETKWYDFDVAVFVDAVNYRVDTIRQTLAGLYTGALTKTGSLNRFAAIHMSAPGNSWRGGCDNLRSKRGLMVDRNARFPARVRRAWSVGKFVVNAN